MNIQLIVVPYDSGRRAYRMGGGPLHLESRVLSDLERDGHDVSTVTVESPESDALHSSFDLARHIAGHVRAADSRGAFPIILAGNCIASIGAFAGLQSRPSVLWLDAHADFNTPETSPSGFLDGMTLAILTGRCMEEPAETIPGFERLPDAEIVMVGVRSVDEGEKDAVARVRLASSAHELSNALRDVQRRDLYLHIDLDCVDPFVLTANQFATPDGLSHDSLLECVRTAASSKHVRALAITAYDPAADERNAGPALVMDILRALLPFIPAHRSIVPKTS